MIDFFTPAFEDFGNVFVLAAWIIVPVFLFALWWELRLHDKRMRFLGGMTWNMLEIRIPRDNLKTPKSMEQVFAALYGAYSFGVSWIARYLEGKVDVWFSFEMVGRDGGVHFYVRTPSQFRHLVESAIYSQYPDAELEEVADYVYEMPARLPNDTYDLWGTGLMLTKDSVYPIRTYHYFEDPKEERRVDPIAAITEAMSKLEGDEMIWVQLLISPVGAATGVDLKKQAEEEVKKIIDEKSSKRLTMEGEEISIGLVGLSEGWRTVIKEIENKASRLAFQTTLRFVYIDRKDSFSPLNVAAVMGSFQQFNTLNLNAIKSDKLVTKVSGWRGKLFPFYRKVKLLSKKRRIYGYYRARRFGFTNRLRQERTLPVFNIEELATLFHFPASVVKAPKLRAVMSRKGEPPENLPVE